MADTPLERALAYQPPQRARGVVTADEITLAIAWARGQVTLDQARIGLVRSRGTATYTILALALRAAVQGGRLTVSDA